MSLISQSIKNLKGGVSQQPDILRFPEQGAAQVNGWSSETEGLQKRSPMVFTKALGDKDYLGKDPLVHLINRDEVEKYYAVFTGTDVKVFGLDGTEYTVRGDRSYVTTSNPRDDLRMITVADYTFIVNRKKKVLESSDVSNSGTFDPKSSALINCRGGQYGRTLIVNINGVECVNYTFPDGGTPADVKSTDAQSVANIVRAGIAAKFPSWTVTAGVGHVYIQVATGDAINTIETKDGYADQLISPVTHYVQSFAKLPLNAPDGYTVKIVGDAAGTSDKYYVRYNYERKLWEETIGWNVGLGVIDNTMPWALVRAADGQFDLKVNTWAQRKSGDDDTNPMPSFVDSTINDVFFFRNRLGFLSGENIILSKTSKYFEFFPASVATLSDDDPIDVAVSHNRISILKYAVPFSEELLLWSDEAQFVLFANGILSSKTVELNLTTQFDVQDKARPFGIGRNVYFASPRASYTSVNRYYAVQDVSQVKNAEDISAHVPSYIPNGVYNIHGSATENFASVLTAGAPHKIFIYKFLYLDEVIQQQSWSEWDFGENVTVYACSSIGSHMYVLMGNELNTWIGTISFTKNTVDLPEEPYRAFMDAKIKYTVPAGSYNLDENVTTLNLNTMYGMSFGRGTVTVLEKDGKITEIEPTGGSWVADGQDFTLDGNLEGAELFVGFNIPFLYEFSKFLIKKDNGDGQTQTEDIGRLQLRRAWVNYENSGAFTVEVENLSTAFRYEMAGARLGSPDLRVGRLNLGTGQFRFSVAGNAKVNTVRVISTNTTPLNVIGCGWEGNYIRRSSGI